MSKACSTGAFLNLGAPLTSRSSSVKWNPVSRPGRQCMGRAYGPGTQKMPSTQALSWLLLSGRLTVPGAE